MRKGGRLDTSMPPTRPPPRRLGFQQVRGLALSFHGAASICKQEICRVLADSQRGGRGHQQRCWPPAPELHSQTVRTLWPSANRNPRSRPSCWRFFGVPSLPAVGSEERFRPILSVLKKESPARVLCEKRRVQLGINGRGSAKGCRIPDSRLTEWQSTQSPGIATRLAANLTFRRWNPSRRISAESGTLQASGSQRLAAWRAGLGPLKPCNTRRRLRRINAS